MVKGLEIFRNHFAYHKDAYILIGGTACDLAMTDFGIEFRATRDLDIVLSMEVLDESFGEVFWEFIQSGGYEIKEQDTTQRCFYRFRRPSNKEYPAELELFSRVPDTLIISDDSTLTPIPMGDDVSSLSAILLDDDYYDWIHQGKIEIEGISTIGAAHLIPLKAKAWLDLRERNQSGDHVDSRKINKHKNDVFRLLSIIDPENSFELTESIYSDMSLYIDLVQNEQVDLKSLGLGKLTMADAIETTKKLYRFG